MALPKVLKTMAVFVDAGNWMGEVTAMTLPKLARQLEEYRGPFDRPIDMDMGGTKLEMEFKSAGVKGDLSSKVGAVLIDGTAVRFTGAYQSDDDGRWQSVEVYVRGRVTELDRGEQKTGSVGEETTKLSLTYYRETIDGAVKVEIDVLNHIYRIGGVDRLAEARRILGI